MARKTRTTTLVWLRRAVQAAFLLLFLYLFLETAYHPINRVGGGVKLFFQLDPLVMLTDWLASHALAAGMLLSLATLAVTFLFGRWFCGWICPFGTLHHWFSSLRGGPVKARLDTGGYSHWQKLKYYVLVVFLAGALLGVNVVGWLDPLSFFFRGMATAVYPALDSAIVSLFTWIYDANPGLGPVRITAASEPIYEFLRRHFLAVQPPHYFGNVLIGLLFGLAIALNFYRARFWCRYICPLGALLGIAGKNPLVRLNKSPEACDNCRLCLADCQGGANLPDTLEWKPAECFYCFNCQSDCPSQAVTLSWGTSFLKPPKDSRLDLGRRQLLASGVAGVGGAFLFRTHPLAGKRSYNPELVRPPGALGEEEFLSKCIRCGECMKVCPTNGIHPAALEAGLEGVWSPVMKMTMGYCEYECTLCTEVCPTGAIRPLTVAEKQKIKIGLAYIDRNRCLPYASARTCIVCEEHCPTPKKAIWFEEAQVTTDQGEKVAVKQPRVDLELCIGCGICTNKCVIKGQPAILVSSAGETRNPDNGVLLEVG
ncbi:MAG: 4Fe-4S binding protein [Bryobacteraceae bacterium]|jgi:ferredoxin